MAGDGYGWLYMGRYSWIWLGYGDTGIALDSLSWLWKAGDGFGWLEMALDGWRWLWIARDRNGRLEIEMDG